MLLLPKYYDNSRVMKEIHQSAFLEIGKAKNEATALQKRLFITKTTDGLELHELDVGLTPDPSADIETRRAAVLARLRGSGTATKEMLKGIISLFYGGEVTIDDAPFVVSVYFEGFNGKPPRYEEMKAALRVVVPAHLLLDVLIRYCTHAQIKPRTHADLRQYTHEKIRNLQAAGG